MKAYVVVRGPLQVAILQAILPADLLEAVVLVPGGERATLVSVGRSLLVSRHKPVAVLVDTHSVDRGVIGEKRQNTQELLRMASTSIPTRAIPLIPEIETVFFQAPGLIEKIFGEQGANEFRLLARYSPKEALTQLFARPGSPKNIDALLNALDAEDIESLRSSGPIQELIAFLQEAIRATAKPTTV